MVWTVALVVFIAQLLCCIFVEGKYKKYIPTLIVAAIMSFVVVDGSLGVIDAVVLVALTKIILMAGLALALYHIVLWIKKRK